MWRINKIEFSLIIKCFVPNGITEREAGNLLARLMCSEKVCGFEMVEVNPTLDRKNLMAEHAFEILVRATNALIND